MSIDDVFARAFQLHQSGRLADAERLYRQGLALQPDSASGHFNLGVALSQLNRPAEAASAFQKSLALAPNQVECLNSLGVALGILGRLDEALEAYWRALKIEPENATVYYNAGIALKAMGRIDPAEAAWRRAVAIRPDFHEALNHLGLVLADRGRLMESVEVLNQALAAKPDSADTLNNLSNSLKDLGRTDEALRVLQRAVAVKGDDADAYTNMGNIFSRMARVEESMQAHRRAMELDPNHAIANSNLIFTMNFHPDCDSAAILREARQWDDRHGKPLRHLIQPHKNSRDADRRLRIGYVSPDFRRHVVGWNLLPLLRQHDREHFEVFCYSSVTRPDAMTEQLRACSGQWREVAPLSDERLAEQIRADGIDILIDLSLHTAGNRLRTFAMAPAPVQITYLGYCGTSGVEAMHYRFSDCQLDPPEQDLSCYSEQTIRLPETYWCYAPGGVAPEPSDLPAERNHHVTFGSMNQFAKVSSAAMDLWCEILKRTPLSRLLIHAPLGEYLSTTRERFDRQGIAPDRVEFVDRQTWDPYIRTYHRIDIALDTFPYNGGITTCDALWMGAPVITLSGRTPVSRGGRSILHNVGLADLAAFSPEEYANLAVALAGDLPRMSRLRKTLRHRMQASPLMDAPRFARNVEAAYRDAWRRWCAKS
jgi:predicted O-linked N-acetylglucosamine transferase (SPINDLY family)